MLKETAKQKRGLKTPTNLQNCKVNYLKKGIKCIPTCYVREDLRNRSLYIHTDHTEDSSFI